MSEYQTKVQRLRAALHKITQIYDDPNLHELSTCYEMNRVAKEALSTTSEPTVAERVREEIRGLLQQWDFRGIAEQLDSGYEKSVVIELVELCEKLTGAKSPRINAPEGDGNE